MKRVLQVSILIILVFLVVSYFIPAVRQKEIAVNNTFDNIASSLFQAKSWIKWDVSVRGAWLKDSTACSLQNDTARKIISIAIPGKKITVSQVSYLFYRIEEVSNHDTADCALSIVPYVGNNQPRSQHHSRIAYLCNTSLFYKIFPFLEQNQYAEQSVTSLKTYLENDVAFYGFPFKLKQTTDTLFLTRKSMLVKNELFKKLPALFDSLEQYAREKHLDPGGRNVYYNFLPHDSLDILAGININRSLIEDYPFQFMKMPAGQVLAVAHFEGPFYDRPRLYQAMRKYLFDHELIQLGVSFEKYLSPLPVSDSSAIKMDLSFPLRY